jgi:hypothetical protein
MYYTSPKFADANFDPPSRGGLFYYVNAMLPAEKHSSCTM